MQFLTHPRRSRTPGYIHSMNVSVIRELEAYGRGIIRGITEPDRLLATQVWNTLNAMEYDADLKLYLPFDEASGATAHDLSGNGNTGTATGTTVVDGVFGKARSFDGTDDYITIADSASLDIAGSCSVELWVYATDAVVTQQFISKSDGSTYIALNIGYIGAGDDTIYFGFYEPSTWCRVFSNTTLPMSQWVHLAGTYDGAYLRIYINGALACTPVAETGAMPTGTGSLKLGEYAWDGLQDYTGYIDEARVCSRALSADETYLHYLAGAIKLGLI